MVILQALRSIRHTLVRFFWSFGEKDRPSHHSNKQQAKKTHTHTHIYYTRPPTHNTYIHTVHRLQSPKHPSSDPLPPIGYTPSSQLPVPIHPSIRLCLNHQQDAFFITPSHTDLVGAHHRRGSSLPLCLLTTTKEAKNVPHPNLLHCSLGPLQAGQRGLEG